MLGKSTSKSPSKQSEYYVWTLPNKPISIKLNIDLISRLQELSAAGLSAPARRAEEAGGLLLGRVPEATSEHITVEVEQCEPIEIEHIRGPSFTLSAPDKSRLFGSIKQASKRKDGLRPVGFFRSHTRPGLYLDEYDFELFKSYFAHPTSVALLIRPAHDEAPTAGFFFWDNGEMQRARTLREFPLSADLLREKKPAAGPVSVGMQTAVPRPAAAVVHHAPVVSEPFPLSEGFPWKKWIWVPLATAAVAVISFFSWNRSDGEAKFGAAVASPPLSLSLNAEPTPSGLRVTWDQKHPAIVNSTAATVFIHDGSSERKLTLTAEQLKSGSMMYTPSTQDVVFRLQAGSVSESLRAIGEILPSQAAAKSEPVESAAAQPATEAQRVPTPVEVSPAVPPIAKVAPPAATPPPATPPAATPPAATPPAATLPTATPPISRPTTMPVAAPTVSAAVPVERPLSRTDSLIPARITRRVEPRVSPTVAIPSETQVSVRVSLDESGSVRGMDLVTLDVDSRLAEAAMNAARAYRFQPARKQNRPVPGTLVLNFRFNAQSGT